MSSGSGPLGSVSSFFGSTLWSIALVMFQVFAIALWLALAYWVYQDARRRSESANVVAGSTAIALIIPFLGALVYLFIRPPEYLTDAHDREIETLALEAQVYGLRCPECDATVGPKFLVCPTCTTSLRQPCRRCSEALEPAWRVCPYCAAPAAPSPSASQSTRVTRVSRDDLIPDAEPLRP